MNKYHFFQPCAGEGNDILVTYLLYTRENYFYKESDFKAIKKIGMVFEGPTPRNGQILYALPFALPNTFNIKHDTSTEYLNKETHFSVRDNNRMTDVDDFKESTRITRLKIENVEFTDEFLVRDQDKELLKKCLEAWKNL